jgi:hypothetical protein
MSGERNFKIRSDREAVQTAGTNELSTGLATLASGLGPNVTDKIAATANFVNATSQHAGILGTYLLNQDNNLWLLAKENPITATASAVATAAAIAYGLHTKWANDKIKGSYQLPIFDNIRDYFNAIAIAGITGEESIDKTGDKGYIPSLYYNYNCYNNNDDKNDINIPVEFVLRAVKFIKNINENYDKMVTKNSILSIFNQIEGNSILGKIRTEVFGEFENIIPTLEPTYYGRTLPKNNQVLALENDKNIKIFKKIFVKEIEYKISSYVGTSFDIKPNELTEDIVKELYTLLSKEINDIKECTPLKKHIKFEDFSKAIKDIKSYDNIYLNDYISNVIESTFEKIQKLIKNKANQCYEMGYIYGESKPDDAKKTIDLYLSYYHDSLDCLIFDYFFEILDDNGKKIKHSSELSSTEVVARNLFLSGLNTEKLRINMKKNEDGKPFLLNWIPAKFMHLENNVISKITLYDICTCYLFDIFENEPQRETKKIIDVILNNELKKINAKCEKYISEHKNLLPEKVAVAVFDNNNKINKTLASNKIVEWLKAPITHEVKPVIPHKYLDEDYDDKASDQFGALKPSEWIYERGVYKKYDNNTKRYVPWNPNVKNEADRNKMEEEFHDNQCAALNTINDDKCNKILKQIIESPSPNFTSINEIINKDNFVSDINAGNIYKIHPKLALQLLKILGYKLIINYTPTGERITSIESFTNWFNRFLIQSEDEELQKLAEHIKNGLHHNVKVFLQLLIKTVNDKSTIFGNDIKYTPIINIDGFNEFANYNEALGIKKLKRNNDIMPEKNYRKILSEYKNIGYDKFARGIELNNIFNELQYGLDGIAGSDSFANLALDLSGYDENNPPVRYTGGSKYQRSGGSNYNSSQNLVVIWADLDQKLSDAGINISQTDKNVIETLLAKAIDENEKGIKLLKSIDKYRMAANQKNLLKGDISLEDILNQADELGDDFNNSVEKTTELFDEIQIRIDLLKNKYLSKESDHEYPSILDINADNPIYYNKI